MAIRMSGMISGLDTDAIVSELVKAYSTKVETYEKAQTKLSWKQDAWKSLNSEVYSLYKTVGNMRYSSAYSLKTASVSDSTKATVSASSEAVNGTQKLKINELAQSAYLTGDEISSSSITTSTTLAELGYSGSENIEFTVGTGDDAKTTSIAIDENTKISDVLNQLKSAGVNASFDTTYNRFYVSAKTSGADSSFSFSTDYSGEGTSALSTLGLASTDNYIEGKDAEIELNGVTYTGNSNSFTINGLTINAQAVTTDPITITTATDSQGLYDKIKSFLNDYNDLINEMTSLYNADSAKGYEPLTDDEKDAMSETEIEKWETKIKDSLLRRDSTLNGIMSVMINAMSGSVTMDTNGNAVTYDSDAGYYTYKGAALVDADGNNITNSTQLRSFINSSANTEGISTYSLGSFGIKTLGVLNAADNEQYAYHIDGDEDDSDTSGNADKLLTAINQNPEVVEAFFKNLSSNLYSAIDAKMKSTTLSSAYTIYNDKEMSQEYSDYTDTISDWEDKLQDLEDYYYDKFSAMETALAELQSNTSALSTLLGTG